MAVGLFSVRECSDVFLITSVNHKETKFMDLVSYICVKISNVSIFSTLNSVLKIFIMYIYIYVCVCVCVCFPCPLH